MNIFEWYFIIGIGYMMYLELISGGLKSQILTVVQFEDSEALERIERDYKLSKEQAESFLFFIIGLFMFLLWPIFLMEDIKNRG